MSEHTPGPWEVARNGKTVNIPRGDKPCHGVYGAFCGTLANAHLIAAAPDLLEALEEIVIYAGGADNALKDEYVMDRVYTAIAKAKKGDSEPGDRT